MEATREWLVVALIPGWIMHELCFIEGNNDTNMTNTETANNRKRSFTYSAPSGQQQI